MWPGHEQHSMLEPNPRTTLVIDSSGRPSKDLAIVEEKEKGVYEFMTTVRCWGCHGEGGRSFPEESSHPDGHHTRPMFSSASSPEDCQDSAISETAATWDPDANQYSHLEPSAYSTSCPWSPTRVPAPNNSARPVLTVRCQNGGILSGRQSRPRTHFPSSAACFTALTPVKMEIVEPMRIDGEPFLRSSLPDALVQEGITPTMLRSPIDTGPKKFSMMTQKTRESSLRILQSANKFKL
ncbi:hypothetical protein BU17DRAFT_71064 [Hysterangium stoloniferum]|nr:hypothetical protein BU17DRAFT_71064 [Hysterangium stoloniferum]